jgi:hypothetical protein
MRCLACNVELTDKEANKKYLNHEEIKNPEDKYIGLCSHCLCDSDGELDLELINSYTE